MAENFINRKPQLRGTAAAWTSNNTVLLDGEWGLETDTNKAKFGDGVTAWNDLPYFGGSGTQTWEATLVENATATTKPLMTGGASVGDGSSAIMEFNDGNTTPTVVLSIPSNFIVQHENSIDLSAPSLTRLGNEILSIDPTGYNTTTNSPNLFEGDGRGEGFEIVVTTAGTRDFGSGNITLAVGDILGKLNGVYYKKVDNNQSGDTQNIQEVLTNGNEITALTKLIFRGVSAGQTEIFESDSGSIHFNNDRLFTFETVNGENRVLIQPNSAGLYSNIDYSSSTEGSVVKDERIYTQRKYVEDKFAGEWNATTNTPTLNNTDVSVKNTKYRVSTTGTVDFGAGEIKFGVNDYVINDGTVWRKYINNNLGGGDLLAANNLNDLENANTAISNLGITATATELNYSDGVTSNIQTQLDAKVSSPILSVVKLTSEVRVNDTTLTIDSDLQITLEANSFYSIDINIIYSAQSTPDIKFQLQAPTGATGNYSEIETSNPIRILTDVLNKNGFGTSRRALLLRCFIKTDEAGIFGLKWAQQVSSGADAVLYQTSNIIATKTG